MVATQTPSDGSKTLGASLRRLRTARGLTQSEAAVRAGLSRATLAVWEGDGRVPTGPALEMLLVVLRPAPRERSRLLALASPRHAQEALRGTPLGAPIHRGQFLRALRLRREMAQTSLALSQGVGQAQVAKWEAGDLALGDETWQGLLHTLGATPDERRAFSDFAAPSESLDLDARLDAIGKAPLPRRDLLLLGLQGELWARAVQDERWDDPLCRVTAQRSHHLVVTGRLDEAAEASRRALVLAQSAGCWRSATHAFYARLWTRRRADALEDEAGQIERWAGRLPDSGERAWMLNCLGMAYARQGDREKALDATERALDMAARHGGLEPWSAAIDRARVRLALGDPDGALRALEGCELSAARLIRVHALADAGEAPPASLLEGVREEVEGGGSWLERQALRKAQRVFSRVRPRPTTA